MEKALWFIGMQPKIKASNTCLTTKMKRLGETRYLLIFYVKTEASRVWIVPLQLLTCWTQEILINGPRMNNKY